MAVDLIAFACPNCRRAYKVKPEFAGRPTICLCRHRIRVPHPRPRKKHRSQTQEETSLHALPVPVPPRPRKKHRSMLYPFLAAIVGMGMVVLAGSLFYSKAIKEEVAVPVYKVYNSGKTSPTTEKPSSPKPGEKPIGPIFSVNFYDEYSSNEVKADAKYKGHSVEVVIGGWDTWDVRNTGDYATLTAHKAIPKPGGGPYELTEGPASVKCIFRRKATLLKVPGGGGGVLFVVRGICKGFDRLPILDDCEVIDVPKK